MLKIFVFTLNKRYICIKKYMEHKNVLQAKKELLRFLKKKKIVATYTYTIYNHEYNMNEVKNIFKKLEYANTNNEIARCYIGLIGNIRANSHIIDTQYWNNETLYNAYLEWKQYICKKFHVN
jgi:hypothetical protein